MSRSRINLILGKDREIREARFGFGVVITIFGIWSVFRLPFFFLIFGDFPLIYSLTEFVKSASVLGVLFISVKYFNELKKTRKLLMTNPEKFISINVTNPPVLTTLVPFILK